MCTPHVKVSIIAIGAAITLLGSPAVIIMYCIRNRSLSRRSHGNFSGGSRPMCFRDLLRRKLEREQQVPRQGIPLEASLEIATASNQRLMILPCWWGWIQSMGHQYMRVPSTSQATTKAQSTQRSQRPNRPERTPSTFLNGLLKSVTWQEQTFRSASNPIQCVPTRALSHQTSFTSSGNPSPIIVDEGDPLPDPPARPKHLVPRPFPAIPHVSPLASSRSSAPTGLKLTAPVSFSQAASQAA
ncbi:hypothetical protein BDZ91DRAFT_52333 [Kalaharituber pfeilii]|nr:hypothetical protein BDZ91DRAFT_52333 [Kalaharituber pfeilii]